MAGLEDFYPELRGKNNINNSEPLSSATNDYYNRLESSPLSSGGKNYKSGQNFNMSSPQLIDRRVPQLIERPKTNQNFDEDDFIDDKGSYEHYSSLGINGVGWVLTNVVAHPFIVLRRQCQVSSDSFRYHQLPFTLIPSMVHLYRVQGISSMWKGLGSALTVRGLVMAVEDCTGKFTPWPVQVDSTSSLRMVGQHLLLKAVSQAIVVPFFSASLVESVQSDIASEKPGIFDFLKEGLLRLGPQSGSRTLPIYLLVPPTVIHTISHYILSTIVKTLTGKIMKSRHRALQEQQGAISKPTGAPAGLSQYREQMSTIIGILTADVILYPLETVLHRLHLQGTRTIIDNLDTGKEVVPIITRYEGFVDCFHSIITEEGVGGLFKGFGALMLQYAVQIAILRISFVSLKEILKVFNPQTDIPTEYVEMHGGGAPEVRPVQNQNQMEESRPVKQQPQQSESPNTIRRRIMNQSQNF